MKIPAALFSTLFVLSAWGAGSLSIAPGETFTVSADQQRMTLDSLTIGDGAKIQFDKGVSQWQLRVQQAKIGSDVLIDARGQNGVAGAGGSGYDSSAKPCEDGRNGASGAQGSAGGDGVSVRLQLGLVRLGALQINTSGGAGGQGGQGGNGQGAGEFSTICKSAPRGGDAGDGGNGGNGGNAGDITVEYWAVSNKVAGLDVPVLIDTKALPGTAGSAGDAGLPGAGSEGRYIKKRTLSGDRAWLGGGDAGARGRPGAAGREGLRGRVLVEQALVSTRPASAVDEQKPATSLEQQSDRKQEIREIKQSLKALMERLDQLENDQ